MKIPNVPGEFAFKALESERYNGGQGWILSNGVFFSKEDAVKVLGENIKWPVEINEDGSVYVPDPSEYEPDNNQL